MRCRQPCRPADWAGLGKATLVLFRARNTLEELCPGGAGAGKGGGGRASPSSSAPDSGAFTPSSLAFTISCNTSGSLSYNWRGTIISAKSLTFGERLQQQCECEKRPNNKTKSTSPSKDECEREGEKEEVRMR